MDDNYKSYEVIVKMQVLSKKFDYNYESSVF